MKKILCALLATGLLLGCQNATSNSKSTDQIKEELKKSIPGITKIDEVNKSKINGLYEVVVGRKVFYVSTDGKYLVFGNVFDIANKKSLTEEKTQELSKIDWNKLPLDLAISEVNGTGKRKLVVFSDPDCPYCQMFEKQVVPQLKDTTVYVFLFPLPIHPNAKSDASKIWCSQNRSQTWIDWMRSKKPLPDNVSCDTTGIDKSIKVGTDLVQVEGTPTIILENGQILQGAASAEQLMGMMDTAAGSKVSSSK